MENTGPVEHVVNISWDGKKWVIDNKSIEVKLRDSIVWNVVGDSSTTAYLQFPYFLLVTTPDGSEIAERKTATANASLELFVLDNKEIIGGRPYYYSIFIPECGENQEPGGSYIEGENPPPKIQVGG